MIAGTEEQNTVIFQGLRKKLSYVTDLTQGPILRV